MKKIAVFLFAICLLSPFCMTAKGAEKDKILKIGLFYDTNALPSANLQNVTGSGAGYGFGFFDSNRTFVELFDANEVYLTVLKDKPMWIGTGNVYFDTLPASFTYTVGAYHLELPNAFQTAQEAASYASGIQGGAFPAYINGQYKVRAGEYMTEELATADLGKLGQSATVVGASRTCYTVSVTGSSKIIFEFDSGGAALAIRPKGKNGASGEAWFKTRSYCGGLEYKRASGNDLSVMSVINMSEYIKGVVPYEMSASWPIEALKVQALCARSYAYNSMGKHGTQGFDLCNTTHCQVYFGTESANENSDRAVDETDSKYVLYGGKIAETYYHSGSGGFTENVENVWGGSNIPYLRGVEDKYLTQLQPWSFTLTLNEITAVLQGKNKTNQRIVDMYVSEFTALGNVRSLTCVEEGGKKLVFSGESARTILNNGVTDKTVKSMRYTVSAQNGIYINDKPLDKGMQQYYAIGKDGTAQIVTGNADIKLATGGGVISPNASTGGGYLISGTGWGHNIGMSQWGANAMAKSGLTCEQIIKHYYTGVEIGTFDY